MNEIVYLSLGSNLGDRQKYLELATDRLSSIVGLKRIAESSLYSSLPIRCPEGTPDFLNKVLKMECSLKPVQLLDHTERIEQALGRTKKGFFSDRVIDIDILLFGERIFKNERLEIPHPRMAERAFVLIPLCEIGPDVTDPLTKRSFANMLKKVGNQGVAPFKDKTGV